MWEQLKEAITTMLAVNVKGPKNPKGVENIGEGKQIPLKTNIEYAMFSQPKFQYSFLYCACILSRYHFLLKSLYKNFEM